MKTQDSAGSLSSNCVQTEATHPGLLGADAGLSQTTGCFGGQRGSCPAVMFIC